MPIKREVEKQSWTGILSPKQLSGQVIWILAIALVGTLLAAGFNPAIFGSSDTEDNQASATGEDSSQTDGQLAPLSVVVTQTGLAVVASTPAYRGSVVWQYQFVNVGERCEPELFAVTSNNPAIHGGNLLTIPSSPNQQDFYRNAWVCFKVADQLGRQAYKVFNIDLGNPTISIRREQSGGQDYLQAYSSEEPTSYRVISWEPIGIGGGGGSSYPRAGTYCEQVFVAPSSIPYFSALSEASAVDGTRVDLIENESHCFEATDGEGNRTYVSASASAGRIHGSQWDKILYADFGGTSGRTSWIAKGPASSSICDGSTFQSVDIADYISPRLTGRLLSVGAVSLSIGDESVHGQYYCFRVTDPFGHQSYRAFRVDLAAPELSFEVSEGGGSAVVSVRDNADILNSWFIGPLTDTQSSCEDIFDNASYPNYIPRYGRKASFTPRADSGKFYCFRVQDGAGNSAVGKYLIP